MEIVGKATRVTIYIGESDRWGQKSLYMAILELLKAEDCAGATVVRGLAGFGAHSRIRTAGIVELSADLPLIVEWVDDPARVARVMPRLRAMVTEGLIACQEVEVVTYGHRRLRALRAAAPVCDLMSREVRTVTPDTPIVEAVEMLIGKSYRALPVVDKKGRPVGILTDGNLLARLKLPNASVQLELNEQELRREMDMLRRSQQTVGDLMVQPVITTSEDAAIADAVRTMTRHGIKRLPVVDRGGRLVGMVSRVDVLRALAQPPVREPDERSVVQPGSHTKVGDVMRTETPTVLADAPLSHVVERLVSAAERRVVVVDDQNRAIGIITDGDVLKRAGTGERAGILHAFTGWLTGGSGGPIDLAQCTAAEVMTSPLITVGPDTPLLTALGLLLQHRIKRLPVVGSDGRLVGLVDRGQIMQAVAQDLPDE